MSYFIPVILSILKPSRIVRNLLPHKQMKENTVCLIHLLLNLQGIQWNCCKIQNCLIFANSISTVNNMFNSMFIIFLISMSQLPKEIA